MIREEAMSRQPDKRKTKLRSLLNKDIGMIRGSLIERYLRCGKERCKCQEGEKHGPFYSLTYTEGDKRKNLYVPKDKVEEVKEGIKAYKRAKETIVSVADMNRRLLKKGGK